MNENANLGSADKLYPVSYFNDYYRNRLSGKLNDSNGFIIGEKLSASEVTDLINNGSMKVMPFINKSQSINYIECHDNFTFFDVLIAVNSKRFKRNFNLFFKIVLRPHGI